jgi:hypothetical protein
MGLRRTNSHSRIDRKPASLDSSIVGSKESPLWCIQTVVKISFHYGLHPFSFPAFACQVDCLHHRIFISRGFQVVADARPQQELATMT